MAIDAGFQDLELLEIIYSDLKYGAKLGCKGKFREPTKSSNAPTSFEYVDRVSDSICERLKQDMQLGLWSSRWEISRKIWHITRLQTNLG